MTTMLDAEFLMHQDYELYVEATRYLREGNFSSFQMNLVTLRERGHHEAFHQLLSMARRTVGYYRSDVEQTVAHQPAVT